ncbi:hypothetical protein VTJ83DRAFT_4659 [Remersonia thermophila]|uniref:D-lactate dehydrogenase n=1 Tax=Remersonia thermophila TaxID=72144 RepID=A0ABR4DAK2_9PEZI
MTKKTIKLAVFSAKPYDKKYLSEVADRFPGAVEVFFYDFALKPKTTSVAKGVDAVCVFVNDDLSAPVLQALHEAGVRAVLLRCAGYNNVDLAVAKQLGIFVANVPSYSPESVAEFAVALLQVLNRHIHRAYNRVRDGNFNLQGLVGTTLHGKTVGLVGLGKIGFAFARILHGYGCRLLAYDPFPNNAFLELGEFRSLEELLSECDIISLHCPLTEQTRHIINDSSLAQMKKGALLINTSRGGLIHTKSVITALKKGQLGGLGIDVYEEEGDLFYKDHSGDIIQDDQLMRLLTFPNVVVTGHQAFLTEEALVEIATTTFQNLHDLITGQECRNSLVKN